MALHRIVGAALVALVLTACSGSAAERQPVSLPTFDAAATEGVPARDAHLVASGWAGASAWAAREAASGRPVVINLFASWCGPCKDEAPLLRQAILDHPDIAFLLVDHLDVRDAGEAFLDEVGLTDVPSLFDDIGDVAGAIQARGMPATAFFRADGALLDVVSGVLTESILAARLSEMQAIARSR